MTAGPSEPSKAPASIARMFDAIASRYDLLNRVLSVGLDRGWRRRALRSLSLTGGERLLDVCTGTADVALAARFMGRGAAEVVGIDFAREMLRVGLRKIRRADLEKTVHLIQADATRMPLSSDSFDAATIAFGIRNVEHPEAACREMYRVLRPGGRLAVLEFGIPSLPVLRQIYLWYFTALLPRIGRSVSGHAAAYSYLPQSVGSFPPPAEFCQMLSVTGFRDPSAVRLATGIVYLYQAIKPLHQ